MANMQGKEILKKQIVEKTVYWKAEYESQSAVPERQELFLIRIVFEERTHTVLNIWKEQKYLRMF